METFHLHFDDIDLINLSKSDLLRLCESLPKFEIISEISKFTNLSSYDIDKNIDNKIECNYYSVDGLNKLDASNNFNIFHSNVNDLEAHFDTLNEFLANNPLKFDVINITETLQNSEHQY